MSEIKELSMGDLIEKIDEKADLYAQMKMNNIVSPLENPLSIRTTRRTIARLKTELNARNKQAEEK